MDRMVGVAKMVEDEGRRREDGRWGWEGLYLVSSYPSPRNLPIPTPLPILAHMIPTPLPPSLHHHYHPIPTTPDIAHRS